MRIILLTYCIFVFLINMNDVFAQYTKTTFLIPKSTTANVSAIEKDWSPSLQNLEMPKPGTQSRRGFLMQLKEKNELKFPRKDINKGQSKSTISEPEVGKSWNGNIFNNRFPNDNDLAISDSGQLVSMINSTIYVYDTNADSIQMSKSFDAFAESLELNDSKFDPRVVYDPNNDRFIAVILNGFLDSTSYIILAFSATADATADWNFYALPGNPLDNDTWSDYPTIAISQTDLFIGINTFTNGSSNNSGFTESVFWQVDLHNGYTGEELNTAYYSDILPEGVSSIFNICPVKGGSSIQGSEMYLLSNRNTSSDSDTMFLMKITGPVSTAELELQTLVLDHRYYLPPNAIQAFNRRFDTGDSRILDAFAENGKIQFVQNTLDTASGRAAVYHGIIDYYKTNPFVRSNILSDTLDLGYPSISYIGGGENDDRAIVSLNHSSVSVFSGCSVYSFDGTSNYSNRLEVKGGDNYVSVGLGFFQRWGDYSGSQRKYNEQEVVWMSGSWGTGNRQNATRIAEIKWNDKSFLSTEQVQKTENKSMVYPNPTADEINVKFTLENADVLHFVLYDINGKLVKRLMKEYAKKGENIFSFSMQPLPPGIYLLNIENANRSVHQQKIVKK